MTNDEIEAWKKRDYVQTGYLGGWPLPNSEAAHGEPLVIWPKAVAFRLLEERKRLLEGASNVRVSLLMLLENPDDPPTPATLAEYATLLGNAIRFAEEAAR